MKPGCVYLAVHSCRQAFKIGRSWNPTRRIRAFEGCRVEDAFFFEGHYDSVFKAELELLDVFSADKAIGFSTKTGWSEWIKFDALDRVISYIRANAGRLRLRLVPLRKLYSPAVAVSKASIPMATFLVGKTKGEIQSIGRIVSHWSLAAESRPNSLTYDLPKLRVSPSEIKFIMRMMRRTEKEVVG